jgi:signal transduction histidine kinase/DNA-binding LacI/PurR family transcriptional regulator/AraC-like DNA-binding protein
MAKTLRHGRPTIGVLAGWQYYWTATPLSYLSPIYRGIRLAAAELGCNLLLGCGMGASASAADLLRPAWPVSTPETDFVPIGSWNTDGLILVNPLHSENRSRYAQDLAAAGFPVVFVGSGERGPTILADNAGGIMQAMRHLVEHGHQRIAFIAGSMEDMEGDSGDRLRAYRAALRAFALVDDPGLLAYGQHTFGSGHAAMQQILSTGMPFSAVLASNDESALGAIQALAEAGRQVPDDVAVIGFDDRPESSVQQPALSSVQVPLFKMGYQAVELLLRRIDGSSATDERVLVPTRLISRESCGCGRSAVLADVLDAISARLKTGERDGHSGRMVQRMAAAVLAETQALGEDETIALCEYLLNTFMVSVAQNDAAGFQKTLAQILRQAIDRGDDAHLWQVAISVLRADLPELLATLPLPLGPDSEEQGREILNQARITISASMRQQHRQVVVNQNWTGDRLGRLAAQLLNILDEAQIYETLAQGLPELGIDTAWVALLDAEGDDPVAWSQLRSVISLEQLEIRFPSREFPPAGLLSAETPFSLALLPLIGGRGRAGYVALDTAQLELNGAIAQELAAAVNTAQLYREATEGRRLAEEANQMKSRFLSTVSHELRTPLNLIVGLTGLLIQQDGADVQALPATLRQDVERIHANAQHLGGLIGDVLDMASSDAGQLRLTREYVDLGQALRLVAETGAQMAAEKGLAWRADLPDSGPWVWGDRMRLRQVALNLLSNAVKFTEHGSVRLTVQTGAESATVTVSDTGMGIPLDEQRTIFDEFRRSERSITRGYRGLGLGLSICKRLVALHEGSMGVYSTGEEGAGSSFYFTLPTVHAPAAREPQPAAPLAAQQSVLLLVPPSGGGERIRQHLTRRGVQVLIERSADTQTWLARLLAAPPSAVVLDASGERGADYGWDALKTIKANPATRNIPVLFYAAARESGAVLELDYLTKPIEIAEFTRALDQHWLVTSADAPVRTFLVVDDDPETLEMHTRIVHAHAPGNRVLKAHNGRDALEIMRRTAVDLVLLDLMMPEMDGFAVLETMRQRETLRDIPVIVVTGQVLTEAEMARLSQGVATVLSKGLFSLDETLVHLDAALERQHRLSSEAQRLVRKAMAYVQQSYQEPLSRHDLARHVGMSDDYLTYCFRQELGMTPIAYLNRYRIAQAKRLLRESDKAITEIALDVGFSDSGYFSRVFRREVGMSPEAFRR